MKWTLITIAIVLASTAADAQELHRAWRTVDGGRPGGRGLYALEYSAASDSLVMVGGRPSRSPSLWFFADGRWTRSRQEVPAGEYAQSGVAGANGEVYFFGGADADHTTAKLYDDFSVWDGTAYTAIDATGPSRRRDAGLAFDSARDVVILFGGYDNRERMTDTWEYADQQWTQLEPAMAPPSNGPVVYHPGRATSVAFVGEEVWEFDGASWELTPGVGPTEVVSATWDSGRNAVIAIGATPASGAWALWAWDGAWELIVESPEHVGWGQDIAYVPDEEAVYGLGGAGLWKLQDDGLTWVDHAVPAARLEMAATWDEVRDVMVVHGGRDELGSILDDTWTYDGEHWSAVAVSPTPGARAGASMVFDRSRGVSVLVGGSEDDTRVWEFDGAVWTAVEPPTAFLTASGVRLVYSEVHERVLAVAVRSEEEGELAIAAWDGAAWEVLESTGAPNRREFPAVWDTARQRLLIYSGRDSSSGSANTDTWAWEGGSWSLVDSAGPAADLDHALVYDPDRDVVVMLNRNGRAAELDGDSWTTVQATAGLPRERAALVYDTAGRRVLAFGGWHDEVLGDIHEYLLVGGPCEGDDDCDSGACADGVCCDQACGASEDDCFACSVEAGGRTDGLCSVVDREGCEEVAAEVDNGGPTEPPTKSNSDDGCCAVTQPPRTLWPAVFLLFFGAVRRRAQRRVRACVRTA